MDVLAYLLLVLSLLGVGTLIASSISARGARIGLGAVLFLALVVDTTWVLVPLIGWSARLVDAIWIALFTLVAVAAILSALRRHDPPSATFRWPSRRDVLFLLLVIMLFGAIVFVLPVPLDTDAQGFGYLALALRDGENYTTLAPWHPDVEYLYSPGFIGLNAHLSSRFEPGLHRLQLIVGAVTAVLFVWAAYDLGNELGGPRLGRAMMLASLGGTGLLTAFMDSHYTALMGISFSLAFITFVLRFLRTLRWTDALFAAICLAAVPLSQPDTTIALIIGYAPWLLIMWLSKPRPDGRAWVILAMGIPLLALLIVAPWLYSLRDLLGSGVDSPFAVESDHWRTMVLMHGGVIAALALLGAVIGVRKRRSVHLWMAVWLVAILEFSTLGLLEQAFPEVMEPLLKYDYPFSLAWHGPIIPYTILGGSGLLWLLDRIGPSRVDRIVSRLAAPVCILAAAGLVAIVFFREPLLSESKDRVGFFGAFSSAADVDAMLWLRDHTAPDARVLNHPGPHEADWAPVITERDTVFFRPQPFFRGIAIEDDRLMTEEQVRFRTFWRDPANPRRTATYLDLLRDYDIQYVLVPQIFDAPEQFDEMLRWRWPVEEAKRYLASSISESIPFLRLVYEKDGARVYEVVVPDVSP